jgi:DNA polymerase-3 subunit delta
MTTNLVEELKRVKKEDPRRLYWITTSNDYLERELFKVISDKISSNSGSLEQIDLNSTDPNDFRFVVSSGSLLVSGKVIVVSGAGKIKADKGKLIVEALNDICPTNVVIFKDDSISGATSLGKYLSSNATIIDDSGLNNKMVLGWAKKRFESHNCDIADDALSALVEKTLGDLTQLAQEIEKIALYVGQDRKATLADVTETTKERIEISIFQVLDDLAAKQTAKGIKLVHKIVANGEPPERLIVMLYNHFFRVLLAKSLTDTKLSQAEIAKKLACHPFVAKKAIQTSAMFTSVELSKYLERLTEAEISFKTGKAKPLEAIECALFELVK